MDFLSTIDLDLQRIASHGGRLAVAFLFALPIAWNREREERSLGLRTFPIVAMASAGYVLIAESSESAAESLPAFSRV